jgi:hypothetical protein
MELRYILIEKTFSLVKPTMPQCGRDDLKNGEHWKAYANK